MYRDDEITAVDVAVLLDAVLHKADLRGYALILLAGNEDCDTSGTLVERH